MAKKYHYIGDGAGVMGLPHEVTDEEAERDDVTELLRAAIENGSYVEVDPIPASSKAKKSTKEEVKHG